MSGTSAPGGPKPGAWERIAAWTGGTVTALAVAPGDRAPGGAGLAVAATAAGLHASTDGGRTWAWRGLGPGPVVEALALSPAFARDQTVLVGTATGLHRSTDGGRRWRPILAGSRIQAIAVAPEEAGGVVLVGTEDDGILRSEDGGQEWSGASAGLLDLTVTALALSPAFARDRTALAGTASGLYRSRNGGRAWRLVEVGPEAPAIQALAVSPAFAEDGLALAGTEADGLFRSDDGGQTWAPVGGAGLQSVTCLAIAPTGGPARLVAAGTGAGLALSADGGQTWRPLAEEVGPILSLAFAPRADGTVLLAGTIGHGVIRVAVDALTWEPANVGLAGRALVGLALAPRAGREPLLAVASLDGGVSVSPDGGASWTTSLDGLDDLADAAASSVACVERGRPEPSILAAVGGRLVRSDDLGASWAPVPIGDPGDGLGDGLGDGRIAALVVPVAPDAAPSAVLAVGGEAVLLSPDGGRSWQALPLPAPGLEVVGGALSPSLARDRSVYVVTRAARSPSSAGAEPPGLVLWHSADLGRSWSRWLEVPDATVVPLAAPRPGALDGPVLAGLPGRVARPLRGAQEVRRRERRPIWQEAPVGAPDATVTALALSPRVERDRTVVAAADAEVYLSRDGGASFTAWTEGLDAALVTGLAVGAGADGQLMAYALGLGGTLWRRRL